VLALVEIPEHSLTVTATRSAERAVGRNSDGVDEGLVGRKRSAELASGEVPDLNQLVAATRNNDWVGHVGREADAGDPVRVGLIDAVLALTDGVPQLDGSVTRTRDDLAVVAGEGDGEDILSVANEAASGDTSVQIPQAKRSVPAGRESKLGIRRQDDILNEVSVALEGALGSAILVLLACESPFNESSITRSSQQHVSGGGRVGVAGGGDGSHPVLVVSELTTED